MARVCVDVPLPHLDRPFDYLVPADLDADAVPGVRVRIRFSGQLVDGYLLARAEASEHPGRLTFLERVVSPEPVVGPDTLALARAVAQRYAGTLADVLRLAVPPRHARAEAAPAAAPAGPAAAPPGPVVAPAGSASTVPAPAGSASTVPGPAGSAGTVPGPGAAADFAGWAAYPAGRAFLTGLAQRRNPRAVWTALPGEDWPARLAEAVAATVHGGRGAVVTVADARDLDRLDAALSALLGPGRHVALSAALGPAERYRRWLAAHRGQVSAVIGTRAAAFAPVANLGLVAIWDDGDDLYAEPRAPYPHAREVLLTRAQLGDAAALLGGYARSVEAQQLLATGWAREVVAPREVVRTRSPAVVPTADDPRDQAPARLPSLAWRAARDALATGAPVLVQVPRRGYLPSVACADCRTPARCANCHGPLALSSAAGTATCRWCGRAAAGYTCPACGGRRLRASVVGARRTAEELGRAFPGVPVRTSGRDEVLATVADEPAVVVSTPGAEPVGRYGAVLLLDTWALLTRADLRAGEEALRRWLAAATLARPDGRVVVVADGGLAPVQALLRFDPGWLAERELAERRELGFPPAVRMASLTGTAAALDELLAAARLPDGTEPLGPVPVADGQERMLLRVPRAAGLALAAALHAALGVRSARKAPDPVRVQIDPLELL
ncbi:MAG: primosomal protein N' [Actinobacteria bacterium]|nr:MAG: primosomal protein N' [Actinomycetota bacterium]